MYAGYATTALVATRAKSSFPYSDLTPTSSSSSAVAINPSLLLLNGYLLHRHSAFLYWSRSRTFLPGTWAARAAAAAADLAPPPPPPLWRRRACDVPCFCSCCCCCGSGGGAATLSFADAAIGLLAWERSDLRLGTSRKEARRGKRRDHTCSACGSERSQRREGGEGRRRLVERKVREVRRCEDDDDEGWEVRERRDRKDRKDKGFKSRVYGNRRREEYDYEEEENDTGRREAYRGTPARRGNRERVGERTAQFEWRGEDSEEEERDLRNGSRKFTRTCDRRENDDRRRVSSSKKASTKDSIRRVEGRDDYDSEEEEQLVRRSEAKERSRNGESDRRVVGRSAWRIEDSEEEERDELDYEARNRSKASARTIDVREDDMRRSSSSSRKMVDAKKVSKQDLIRGERDDFLRKEEQLVRRADLKEKYQNSNRKIVEDDSRIIRSSNNRFDSRKTDNSVGVASSSKQSTKYDMQIVGHDESRRSSEKIMDISEVQNSNIQNQQQYKEDNSTSIRNSTQRIRNDRTQINQQVSGRTELDISNTRKEDTSVVKASSKSNSDNKMFREDNFTSVRNSEQQIRDSRSQINQQVINRADLSTSKVRNRHSEIDQEVTRYAESSKSSEKLVDISEDRTSDVTRVSRSERIYGDRREDRRDTPTSTQNIAEVSRDKRTDINQQIVYNTELDVQNITQVNVTNVASSNSQSIEENRRDDREHTTLLVNLAGGSHSSTRRDDEINRQGLEVSRTNMERLAGSQQIDDAMIENRRLGRQRSFRVDSDQNRRDDREHATLPVNLVGGSHSSTTRDDEINRQGLEVSRTNVERLAGSQQTDDAMIENRRLEHQRSFRVDSYQNRRGEQEHATLLVNLVGGSHSSTRRDGEINRQGLEVSRTNIERIAGSQQIDDAMIENRRLERQRSFRVDSDQTVLSNYSRSDIGRVSDSNMRRENREESSALMIREVEEERSRIQEERQQQTSQMVISGSLESASRLQDSSTSYVGEFVDRLSQEMSNSDKRDNSLKISSQIQVEAAHSGASQGTGVDTTTKHKDGKHTQEVSTTSTQTGETSSAQKTHKSLWAFVADIIRLGWIRQGESHNSDKKSSKKSSSHNSTSTDAWFSGQEQEAGETKKKAKISSPKEQQLLGERPFDTQTSGDRMIISEAGASTSTSVDLTRESRERIEFHEEGRRSTPSSVITVDQPSNRMDDTASASVIEMTDSGNAQVPVIEEPPEILQSEGEDGELRRRKLQRKKQVLKETFDEWEEASAYTIPITDSGNAQVPVIEEPHEMVQSEGKDGELEHRKLQRNKQVLKETFDEWEEAFRRDNEQRKLDEFFMREALAEAQRAADIWEVPVGAVLVQNGEIIARGCNLVEELRDSTAHAEMICIREASNVLRSWRLAGTTLYITLEPCPMCAGAILQARINAVVWGAPNKLLGADGSWVRLFPENGGSDSSNPSDKPAGPAHPFHPKMAIRRGVLAAECAEVMQQFFHLRRKNKKKNRKAEPPPPSCLPLPTHPLKFFTKMHGTFAAFFSV